MATECKQHCPEHEENTAAINKHAGLWAFLLIVVAGAIMGGWYLIDRIEAQNRQNYSMLIAEVGKIRESTQQIDKTFTAYMASDRQRTLEMSRTLDDHEARLRELEGRK